MTDERLSLSVLLAKGGNGDLLRSMTETVLQMLMEAAAEGLIGAGTKKSGRRAHGPTADPPWSFLSPEPSL